MSLEPLSHRRLVPNCHLFLPPSFSFSPVESSLLFLLELETFPILIGIIVAVNDLLPLKLLGKFRRVIRLLFGNSRG